MTAICLVALLTAAASYFYIDPSLSAWAPKCPVKLLTGWECPSCGFQRALHAALHLRFSQALAYNPFMMISVPYFLLAVYAWWLNGPGWRWIRDRLFSPAALYVYIAVWAAWGVIRNLI